MFSPSITLNFKFFKKIRNVIQMGFFLKTLNYYMKSSIIARNPQLLHETPQLLHETPQLIKIIQKCEKSLKR